MSKRIKILVVDDESLYVKYKIVPILQKVLEMYNEKYKTELICEFVVLDENSKFPNLIIDNSDCAMAVVDLKLEGWRVDGFHVLQTIHDFCPNCSKLIISQYLKDELSIHFPNLKIEDFVSVKLECSYASKSLLIEGNVGLQILAEKIFPLIRVWAMRDMIEKECEIQLSKLSLLKCDLKYWFHDVGNVMMPIYNAQFFIEQLVQDVDQVVLGICKLLGVVSVAKVTKCGSCSIGSMFVPINTNWFTLKKEISKLLKCTEVFCKYIMDGKKVFYDGLLDIKEVDINSVIREMVVLNEYRMNRKKMSISFCGDDGIPLIELDENLFRRVVQNLISNACDAVSEKSFQLDIVSMLLNDNDLGDCVVLQFKDNGKGWSKDLNEKIWQEGFTTKGAMGSGLGLHLVKKVVEKSFHGRIFGDSVENQGSVFRIRMPVKQNKIETDTEINE